MLKFEFNFVFFIIFLLFIIITIFVASGKSPFKTTADWERTNGAMKTAFFLPHAPVYPLHADINFGVWKCFNSTNTSTQILYCAKKRVFRNGWNFHISRYFQEMIQPVNCTLGCPLYFPITFLLHDRRKIYVFCEIRKHVQKVHYPLKRLHPNIQKHNRGHSKSMPKF